MGILALNADERVTHIEFNEVMLTVSLMDGRKISVPLDWYPKLANATPDQQQSWTIIGGGYGMHWEDLDEDLHISGLLRGAPAPHISQSQSNP